MRTTTILTLVASLSFVGLAGCTQTDFSSMNSYRLSKAIIDILATGKVQPEDSVQYDERNTRKLADYSESDDVEADLMVEMGRAAAKRAQVTWQLEEISYRALGENMISALDAAKDFEVVVWGEGMSGARGKIVPKSSFEHLPVPCRTLDVVIDAKGDRFGASIGACKKSEVWKLVDARK